MPRTCTDCKNLMARDCMPYYEECSRDSETDSGRLVCRMGKWMICFRGNDFLSQLRAYTRIAVDCKYYEEDGA